jgi:predicted transcriptional regulator
MTDQAKKTDVLNIRMDPALAAEIQRIAEWRGSSASEVARELIRHGVTVERQLEAQELRRPYERSRIERDLDRGYLKIEAEWVWYSWKELQEIEEARDEAMAASYRP